MKKTQNNNQDNINFKLYMKWLEKGIQGNRPQAQYNICNDHDNYHDDYDNSRMKKLIIIKKQIQLLLVKPQLLSL